MTHSKPSPLCWTILLVILGRYFVRCADEAPNPCMSEAKSELKEILAQIASIKSNLAKEIKGTNTIVAIEDDKEENKDGSDRVLLYHNATFFLQEGGKGDSVSYDANELIKNRPACLNVEPIKSMQMSASCVRVFAQVDCYGISRSLYPSSETVMGSYVNLVSEPDFKSIKSVGPCPWNEFAYASVSYSGTSISVTKDESNTYSVPDNVDFTGYHSNMKLSTKTPGGSTNPITHYVMESCRPKWVRAVLKKSHINRKMGVKAQINMVIPPGLGGSKNEPYNSFEQGRGSFEFWSEILDSVLLFLEGSDDKGKVHVYMTFLYQSSGESQPYGMFYAVVFHHYDVWYGFINNNQ